jgi:MoxR-like ATPase
MAVDMKAKAEEFRTQFKNLRDEIGRVIVGHDEIVEGVLTCLFVGGNCLLEGVPGLGKTMLVRTLAETLDLEFSRVQFTPDLMPADIIGTNIIREDERGNRALVFQPGPLFAQIILADEINRATPKTQSAMLEAMQEHSITVGGTTHKMKEPFFVLATQNPLEMDGTYPLPEAQLDRFMMKLEVNYSNREQLTEVVTRTTEGIKVEAKKVMDGTLINEWRLLVREVIVAPQVKDFAVRLVLASHPGGEYAAPVANQFVRYGASPRAAQALILCAKVRALLSGRYNVAFEDIEAVAHACLRHRLILNFEGEAEGISTDLVVDEMLKHAPRVLEAVGA